MQKFKITNMSNLVRLIKLRDKEVSIQINLKPENISQVNSSFIHPKTIYARHYFGEAELSKVWCLPLLSRNLTGWQKIQIYKQLTMI